MTNRVLLLCVAALLHGLAGAAVAEAPAGTLGFRATVLFDDSAAANRGDLVLVDVWAGGPAAAAGLQKGDIVVAIDGTPVAGKDASQVFKVPLHGAAGGKVHLTVLRPADGLHKLEVDLTRVAIPKRQNPAFESFGYSVPRSWSLETYGFPLPWAPRIAYSGIEDVLLMPAFDDHAAATYHGVVWVWWLDGSPAFDAGSLRSLLVEYFRGLSLERAANGRFNPDLDRVTATLAPAAAAAPGAAKAARSAATAYRGEVVTYDREGDLITLQVDVEEPKCPGDHRTALLFRLAPRPREDAIWKDLQAVTGSFRCRRS
jgi:hypothetical protein